MKKVAINGFGRIGRLVMRAIKANHPEMEVVAINDLTDAKTLAHLFKYDSVHKRYPGTVEARENSIVIDGAEINIYSERNPADLPWGKLGVELVFECTGIFRTKAQCGLHIQAGAKKVALSVPAKDEVDATIVLGVNDNLLTDDHKIVSNASCTTNCLAPVAKVLHDNFGIKAGLMTTVHSFTNDQRILDLPHSDLRRARAASVNMIPTTTGAAKALGKVIPELDGVLDGIAIRVPTPDGSLVDLAVTLERTPTVEEINAAMKKAAENEMKGVLYYSEEPLVSTDIVGDPSSSVFDSLMTAVQGDIVKILTWYDNEWGYSNRLADLASKMLSF
ncbi:MAG: type I glyceraldehyde-3-phosphate dehydrogenase [Candidatus Cloacimonetes bacterium 4572_65]|nr:MAG: type I glyceraldehyde-3-phosphate dehydrogenase [Candidatus Cloacimonetes bacterium 4572_65]